MGTRLLGNGVLGNGILGNGVLGNGEQGKWATRMGIESLNIIKFYYSSPMLLLFKMPVPSEPRFTYVKYVLEALISYPKLLCDPRPTPLQRTFIYISA